MSHDVNDDLDDVLGDALDDALDDEPLVRAARRVADEVLTPAAAAVDAGSVPRSHLDALATAGLLGLEAPPEAGGAAAAPAVRRRVTEVLAGADLATWFVQVQHHAPVRAVAAAGAPFADRLADLAAGRTIAGIAFSHLRGWPRRPVTATALGGGAWRFGGVAPWYTGWGLNDVALLAGATEDGEVVHALVPARPGPGLRASEPLEVAALGAARTVVLTLDGLDVAAEDVVSVQRIESWRARDDEQTANVSPAVFGVTESALRLLAAEGDRRGEPAARDAARRLADRWRAVRGEAYRLIDTVAPGEAVAERLALRARAHRLVVEATTGLVVAGAGASMARTSPAQRLAREALFLLVQAQTVASRTANLAAIGRQPA